MVQFDGTPPTPNTHSLCLWQRQSRVEDHSLLVHDPWTQQWPILCSLLWSTFWPGNHCPAASCSLNLHVREPKEKQNTARHCLFPFLQCKNHSLSCYMIIQVPFFMFERSSAKCSSDCTHWSVCAFWNHEGKWKKKKKAIFTFTVPVYLEIKVEIKE